MRQFALRHHYRFPLFGPLMYEHANREGYGTVTDVSSIGWRVSGSLPLEPGDVCSLKVRLSPMLWVSVAAGKVRWVQGEEAGIETLVMNEESEARLNAYIFERIKTL
ncbi:MAG: PilZ domain-containing protein [Nitrospira sp.]|nr:PilZ domain-containing protein [Nitrospira sp.]